MDERLEWILPRRPTTYVRAFSHYYPIIFLALFSLAASVYGDDTIPLPTRLISLPAQKKDAIRSPIRFDTVSLKSTPGTGNDMNRVLATDVSSQTTGLLSDNALIVRGGRFDENLYILNGMEFPNLDHFSIGPEGSFGIISATTLRDLKVYAGNTPSEFASSASSAIQVDTRSGNPAHLSAELGLSVTGGEAVIEGPLGFRSASFLAQVRYFDIRPLRDWVTTGQMPRFLDGILSLDFNHSDDSYSRIFGLFTVDTMSTSLSGYDYTRFDGAARAGLSYSYHLRTGKIEYEGGASWLLSSKASEWSPDFPAATGGANTSLSEQEKNGRVYVKTSFGEDTSSQFQIGADAKVSNPDLKQVSINGKGDTSLANVRLGTFSEYNGELGLYSFNLGLRVEYFSIYSKLGLSPQVSLSRKLGSSFRLTLDASLRNTPQGELPDVAAFALLDDSHPPYDLATLALKRIWYLDASLTARLNDVKYEVTSYAKLYDREFRFVDGLERAYYGGSEVNDGRTISVFEDPTGKRFVEGLELKATGELKKRLRFSLGLSLLDIENEYLDGNFRPDKDDYGITAKATGYWAIARHQLFSLSATASGGRPYWGEDQVDGSRYYSERFPSIFNLNTRYTLNWNWRRTRLLAYVEVDNLLNQTPDVYQDIRNDGSIENRSLNGIFPLIGFQLTI